MKKHFASYTLLFLAGRILDSARSGDFLAWIIPAVLLIPLLGLAHANGLIDFMPVLSDQRPTASLVAGRLYGDVRLMKVYAAPTSFAYFGLLSASGACLRHCLAESARSPLRRICGWSGSRWTTRLRAMTLVRLPGVLLK